MKKVLAILLTKKGQCHSCKAVRTEKKKQEQEETKS